MSSSLKLAQQMPDVKVISFDLDDTLWDGTEVIVKAEQAMMHWISVNASNVLLQFDKDDLRAAKVNFAKQHPELLHKTSQLRQRFLEYLFAQCDIEHPEHAAEQCFQHFYRVRQQVRLFDAVPNTLKRLKQDYRLIAITNGNACTKTIGLDNYLSLSLNAEDFDAPKPDADIFEHALHQLNIEAHECLHVGDHPFHDMQGAHEVGMHTAWLKDGTREWPHAFQPDLIISDVIELIQ
ncbi:HAD family hydrolase [Bermanella marisrubri]|uniref:HAD-superfamily hydrolase n=1 Tax=Bermanella marisrubri TaxID=207949 RepID=Q1N421_9GAMM|nr:HAD family hydrolase [Bermanella marisrubri]EAT13044.1 HAD-superfamily hydrolase [Oceanobacter sp. RED65] [Bermanella marisrubri]QIZ82836.1 HAD family hydrolase [Bermanella marisrubri]